MPLCSISRIGRNSLFDRCKPSSEGIEQVMYIYNRDDIASYVRNTANPQIIEGIVMKTGKLGYRFEGFNQAIKGRAELVKRTFANVWDHIVSGIIFERGSEAKQLLEGIAGGHFVVVLENMHKDGDGAFDVFGTDKGLESRSASINAQNAETAGAYPFELGSSETNKESHTPATLYIASYAATKTMLEATITPVPVEVVTP